MLLGTGRQLGASTPASSRLRRSFLDGVSKCRLSLFIHAHRHSGKQGKDHFQSRVARRCPSGQNQESRTYVNLSSDVGPSLFSSPLSARSVIGSYYSTDEPCVHPTICFSTLPSVFLSLHSFFPDRPFVYSIVRLMVYP